MKTFSISLSKFIFFKFSKGLIKDRSLLSIFNKIVLFGILLFNLLAVPAYSQGDIDVTLIERTPRIDFDSGNGYGREFWYDKSRGWPSEGQLVTFVAHVKNADTNTATPSCQYAWKIDGVVVKTGIIPSLQAVPANQLAEQKINLEWIWDPMPHTIEFVADNGNAVLEKCERNNVLSVISNAITVGFWVERTRYEYTNQTQYEHLLKYGVESNSWEDWAQRQIKEWNRMLAMSGVIDRVSLDLIVITEDNALPLAGGFYDTNYPDLSDHSVDLEWGFPTVDWAGNPFLRVEYFEGRSVQEDSYLIENSLLHEMSHARTIEDIYGINVVLGGNTGIVDPPWLIPTLPWFDHLYYNSGSGIMGGGYHSSPDYGQYLQNAWNSISSLRAIGGNTNGTSKPTYPADLPADMNLKILDRTGNPLPNAQVRIFTYNGMGYTKIFNTTPARTVTTDEVGVIDLGINPFGIVQWEDFQLREKLVLLAEISLGGQKVKKFVESSEFILAYFNGSKNRCDLPIHTNIIAGTDPALSIISPIDNENFAGQRQVTFAMSPSINAVRIDFEIDGIVYHSETKAPYVWGDNNPVGDNGWNTRELKNGNHVVSVKAYNTTNNLVASDQVTVNLDNDPPRIIFIAGRQLDGNKALVSWGTDIASTSRVEYGTDTTYGFTTPFDNNAVQYHTAELSGLLANTVYHFRVYSRDWLGREIVSNDQTFLHIPMSPNAAPIANAGADQVINLPQDKIILDGSLTTDPDNNKIFYSWKQISGPICTITIDNAMPGNAIITDIKAGEFKFELTASDGALSSKDTAIVTIKGHDNIALNKPAKASSTECSQYIESFVNDGNNGTRWSSIFCDPQYIQIDLGRTFEIHQVVLNWENASAKEYEIQVSNDGIHWWTVRTINNSNGGSETLDLCYYDNTNHTTPKASFIRMYGKKRNTPYGYSLYEFEVYGELIENIAPVGNVINLKAVINNKFVCAENYGNSPLIANRTIAANWEKFKVVDAGDGNIVLQAIVNGKFVCAENYGNSSLIARSTNVGTWETFQWIVNTDGTISLKAIINGKYVTADNFGNSPLIAQASVIDTWEKFNVTILTENLKSSSFQEVPVSETDEIISVYPVPAINELHIDIPEIEGPTDICIYSIEGRLLYKTTTTQSLNTIQARELTRSGLVIVKVISANHTSTIRALIEQ
jgi:hypothetical protein